MDVNIIHNRLTIIVDNVKRCGSASRIRSFHGQQVGCNVFDWQHHDLIRDSNKRGHSNTSIFDEFGNIWRHISPCAIPNYQKKF